MEPSYSQGWTSNVAELLTAEETNSRINWENGPAFQALSLTGLLVTFYLQKYKRGQNINIAASLPLEFENQ